MQKVHYIIRDNGDGSQSLEWFKDSFATAETLHEAANNDMYNSYQSGDGIQLTTLEFPEAFDLDSIDGISWGTTLPGDYS